MNLGAPEHEARVLATRLRPAICLKQAEGSVLHVENKSSALDISLSDWNWIEACLLRGENVAARQGTFLWMSSILPSDSWEITDLHFNQDYGNIATVNEE